MKPFDVSFYLSQLDGDKDAEIQKLLDAIGREDVLSDDPELVRLLQEAGEQSRPAWLVEALAALDGGGDIVSEYLDREQTQPHWLRVAMKRLAGEELSDADVMSTGEPWPSWLSTAEQRAEFLREEREHQAKARKSAPVVEHVPLPVADHPASVAPLASETGSGPRAIICEIELSPEDAAEQRRMIREAHEKGEVYVSEQAKGTN